MLELPYLFGVRYLEPAAQADLSRAMIGYWARFADAGNPNGPGLPKWFGFRSGVRAAGGAGGIHRTEFVVDHNYAFWHDLAG